MRFKAKPSAGTAQRDHGMKMRRKSKASGKKPKSSKTLATSTKAGTKEGQYQQTIQTIVDIMQEEHKEATDLLGNLKA